MRPQHEKARSNGQTYFVTFQTSSRAPLFRHERWLILLLLTIEAYQARFDLHDYVLMPDHLHLLLTPEGALERPIQLIKGGFLFRARRELGWTSEVWQKGYTDHRIRDNQDFAVHVRYIAKNFHEVGEAAKGGKQRHSSGGVLRTVPMPPRLKPHFFTDEDGAAEAAPLQRNMSITAVPPGTAQQALLGAGETVPPKAAGRAPSSSLSHALLRYSPADWMK